MFVGREKELREMNRRYEQSGFQFLVVYGRRRVGKTRLIREFISNKKAFYFMATEKDSRSLLKEISYQLKMQLDDKSLEFLDSFPSWETLFKYIDNISRQERFVFVIDEYPYLAKSEPAISSIIQKAIDLSLRETKLYLILCGSSMSFMEKQVLGYKSPLYGRRTAQMLIHPLNYLDSIEFFRDWNIEDKLIGYGICGGIPQYLEYFGMYASLKEAIVGEFLSLSGHLQDEPRNLMYQELREPVVYNSIIGAIAGGATKQNEIAMAVNKPNNNITAYLENLISLEIVGKKLPVGEKNHRRIVYYIKDNLYRFWFFFMPRCMPFISMGLGEESYEKIIAPLLDDFFGHIFEDVCMQYLEMQIAMGNMPMLYYELGFWQGANPKEKRTEEIDVVLSGKNDILVGECKWTNKKAGIDVFDTLKERAALIAGDRSIRYAIFSKSGFDSKLEGYACINNSLSLYTIDDLISIKPNNNCQQL